MESENRLAKVDDIGLPDIDLLKKRYEAIQAIKNSILTDEDFYQSKRGRATRKSGWLKYGMAFGLSYKIIGERKEVSPTDSTKYSYHVTVQCVAPGGRVAEATGTCTINEKETIVTEHICRAMADTRATERAIIKMLGTNEIPAEDLPADEKPDEPAIFCNCREPKPRFEEPHRCHTCNEVVKPETVKKLMTPEARAK